jgi:hypothetical protein
MEKCQYAGVECEYIEKANKESAWNMFGILYTSFGSQFLNLLKKKFELDIDMSNICDEKDITSYMALECLLLKSKPKAIEIMQEIEKELKDGKNE